MIQHIGQNYRGLHCPKESLKTWLEDIDWLDMFITSHIAVSTLNDVCSNSEGKAMIEGASIDEGPAITQRKAALIAGVHRKKAKMQAVLPCHSVPKDAWQKTVVCLRDSRTLEALGATDPHLRPRVRPPLVCHGCSEARSPRSPAILIINNGTVCNLESFKVRQATKHPYIQHRILVFPRCGIHGGCGIHTSSIEFAWL